MEHAPLIDDTDENDYGWRYSLASRHSEPLGPPPVLTPCFIPGCSLSMALVHGATLVDVDGDAAQFGWNRYDFRCPDHHTASVQTREPIDEWLRGHIDTTRGDQ